MPSGYKLLMLLSTPFPLRPSAAIRLAGQYRQPLAALSSVASSHGRLLSAPTYSKIGFLVRPAEKVHTQALVKEGHSDIVAPNCGSKDSHAWPEWSKLVDHLLANGYLQRRVCPSDEDDSFLTGMELPEAFLKAADACLEYAKERPDILRLLTKKNIEKLVENVSPSLFRCGEMSVRRMKLFLSGQESELEKAQTIDIMRYLLSYTYKQFCASYGNQFIADESLEMSVRKLCIELYNLSGTIWSDKSAKPSTVESPSMHEQISRPSGQSFEMKRGDWICPKCTFVNFARNMSCLECGETRTKKQLTGAEWECPKCDFFNYGRNMSCLRCDCKRPGDVPLSSAAATGVGHSRSSNIEPFSLPDEQDSNGGDRSKKIGSEDASDSITRSLDRIFSRSSSSGSRSSNGDNATPDNFGSSDYQQSTAKQRRKPNSFPFVPLPPDMFKKNQEPNSAVQQLSGEGVSPTPSASELIDSLLKSSESHTSSNNSKEPSDSSLRWSKASVELDNAKEMSDEDLPDIMPMRRGENRFVVSKKKDRSFTSPAYKRRLAVEQANNYNSVPFVPFPPGYFAKKDNQTATASAESSASMDVKAETTPKSEDKQQLRSSSTQSEGSIHGDCYKSNNYGKNMDQGNISMDHGAHPGESSRLWNSNSRVGRDGGCSPANDASIGSAHEAQSMHIRQNNENGGYSGKSLEGSLVKEVDPLDMSEEAKAERWFRRAAQINDISELSQIPDEDFPEIMPLRKGVNRFVVSKRKTPLERRLTSPHYRRNLPTVSSDLDEDASN